MNKVIQAYAPLDSLYDYRRGLIQKWLTKNMAVADEDALSDEAFANYQTQRRVAGDNLWELHIERNYRERRMDTFEYPFFGMNQAVFRQLYAERTIRDFGYGYYPSKFMQKFLSVVIELEQLTELPIMIKGVMLTINVFPYVFDDAMKQDLVDHCKTRWGGRVDVQVIDVDDRPQHPEWYKRYDYVFKYDMMLSEDYQQFFTHIGKQPIPNVTFVVPDLLVKETKELEGTISDRLFAQSVLTGASYKAVPALRVLYDYE